MTKIATKQCMPDLEQEKVFLFPQGMAGFQQAKHFGFIYEGKGVLACMQSVDDPAAAFIVTLWDEQRLGPPPGLTAEQSQCLRLDPETHPLWFLVLNPFADPDWVVANRRAPIAINEQTRIGLQCIPPDSDLELRFPWMPQPKSVVPSPSKTDQEPVVCGP